MNYVGFEGKKFCLTPIRRMIQMSTKREREKYTYISPHLNSAGQNSKLNL